MKTYLFMLSLSAFIIISYSIACAQDQYGGELHDIRMDPYQPRGMDLPPVDNDNSSGGLIEFYRQHRDLHESWPFPFNILPPGIFFSHPIPVDGRQWANSDPNDWSTVPVSYGTVSAKHRRLIWDGNGHLLPGPGWKWAHPSTDSLAVVRVPTTSSRELDRSLPRDASVKNFEYDRRPDNYSAVIRQFDVEHDRRYAADKRTYCNIFVWDVSRAMSAELPLLTANRTAAWLQSEGAIHGWYPVTAQAAQLVANDGRPTIAIWRNPKEDFEKDAGKEEKNHGHVAVVRPGSPSFGEHGPALAQAGRHNYDATHLEKGFNDPHHSKEIQFWYHN
jgi:hypothetical protein